ncbi:phospholipid scramblase-related protein [Pedobacter miscanthi]|uniref:phospholipid scramblase-related protein n=1 Tax=Pedobacter miscanthi TaxID=2259170 RepID=UPI00292D450A|nr:phospholipid scramblase-related protein [Pedobacter miscanthi]
MNASLNIFYLNNQYVTDEQINTFTFARNYKIYNIEGEEIGLIKQRIKDWQRVLPLLINKSILPFKIEITDKSGVLVASVLRNFGIWNPKMKIVDEYGNVVGIVKLSLGILSRTLSIVDPISNKNIAKMTGDGKGWSFDVISNKDIKIGEINKSSLQSNTKFKEDDKYCTTIFKDYIKDIYRMPIISIAIIIDMILKQSR